MRKTFRFVVAVSLILLFQNCSSNSSNVLKEALIQSAGSSSGNGGTYNGVMAFVRLVPGFTCEGISAPAAVLQQDALGNWSLVDNTPSKCGASTTPLASLGYQYPHHFQNLNGEVFSLDLLHLASVREFLIDPSADPNSHNDVSGLGLCANAQGQCSLQAAFDELNSSDQPTILNLPAGHFNLNSTLNISILSPVLIQGVAGQTILDGANIAQGGIMTILPIYGGNSVFWSSTVSINDIRFMNARAVDNVGSAIDLFLGSVRLSEDEFANISGSYAVNGSAGNEMIIDSSSFHDNAAQTTVRAANMSWFEVLGSQIYNGQLAVDSESNFSVDVENSLLYNNSQGMVIANTCQDVCMIQNTTLANNLELGVMVRSFVMGQTFNDVVLRNSTLVNNGINVDYSKIEVAGQMGGDHLVLQNTILSKGNGSSKTVNCNLADPYPAQAYLVAQSSMVDDNSCGTNGFIIANPQLQPLGMNGGPLQTILLSPTSPAIDAGNNLYCPATDARGLPRPMNYLKATSAATCDMGAVEMQ